MKPLLVTLLYLVGRRPFDHVSLWPRQALERLADLATASEIPASRGPEIAAALAEFRVIARPGNIRETPENLDALAVALDGLARVLPCPQETRQCLVVAAGRLRLIAQAWRAIEGVLDRPTFHPA